MSDLLTTQVADKNKRKKNREVEFVARDLITALSLCHNVTPAYPDPNDDSIREFQASSPDEIALVKFADHLGMQLIDRDQNQITIKNPAGNKEQYEVMANFPFSSDTKRMGIVLRNVKNNLFIFYLKGAEVVMKHKVKPNQRCTVDEAVDNLAMYLNPCINYL